MSENALFIIFSSLKKFCGEDLDVHKKIAFISQFATELCFPTYFTDLSAQVKIYKSIFNRVVPLTSQSHYYRIYFRTQNLAFRRWVNSVFTIFNRLTQYNNYLRNQR
jgi:hypothetical protein